ncbi:MAG: DUF2190 family protein [Desulfitobacteriaceae bacterium]|nr:DUF2190 family protein [Desulfitobacteriaceae bacterium]
MATFFPILTIGVEPSGVINPNRFVSFSGAQAVLGQAARGVTHEGAEVDEKQMSLITMGTAIIEAGTAFAAETRLTSDADGKAIAAVDASGHFVNAIAVEAAAAAGDKVEVILVAPTLKA